MLGMIVFVVRKASFVFLLFSRAEKFLLTLVRLIGIINWLFPLLLVKFIVNDFDKAKQLVIYLINK